MKSVVVRVKRLDGASLPQKQTSGSSGFDLTAATGCRIPPHGFSTVGTGLAIEMPASVEAQVRPRSGLAANHGIGVLNSPGTIDSDYRGEIKVILFNMSAESYQVMAGDRIAQLVFSHVVSVELRETGDLSDTGRGDGGFGHTG